MRFFTRPACHTRSTRTSSSLNCKNQQTSQHCLSGKAFRFRPIMRCWGLPFDEALGCMDRRAGTPERFCIAANRRGWLAASGRVAEFFRAQTLPPARSPQDSLFWSSPLRAGGLTGDWGRLRSDVGQRSSSRTPLDAMSPERSTACNAAPLGEAKPLAPIR
jgi:hypothetical protein